MLQTSPPWCRVVIEGENRGANQEEGIGAWFTILSSISASQSMFP
jgi:hypothetical protein